MKKNYKMFFVFVVLALIAREELALTVLAIGIFAFFKYDRKIGTITILSSLVWILLVFNLIFPYYMPFSNPNLKRGGDVLGAVNELVSNPKAVFKLNTEENRKYLFDIFSPVAFISFLSPQTLFLALPALGINLLTTWPYAHSINYHYTYAIIPFVFISAVYSFSFLRNSMTKRKLPQKIFYILLVVFIIFSLPGDIWIGPGSTSLKDNSIIKTIENFNQFSGADKTRYEAISLIPEDATVSATYLFVPHLSHREIIYMFPNPFKESYWGAELGNFTPPTPTKDVDYIVLDDTINNFERDNVVSPLLDKGAYFILFEKGDIKVLERDRSAEITIQ
jgi:uncharacterized membrane protein